MDKKKLLYLLSDANEYLCKLVDGVITDSKIYPCGSAVTTTNLIKCYMQVMKDIGKNLSFDTVEGYLENSNNFTDKEITEFENIRKKESKYFKDEQF